MTAYWALSVLCAVVAVIDGYRRPESTWVGADRNRGWWLSTIAVLGLFGLGPLALAAYGVGVVPPLQAAQSRASDHSFGKR